MVCDSLAAGMTYQGKEWTKEYQLSYWNRVKGKAKLHPAMFQLLERFYKEVSIQGVNPVLKKKYLKKLYEEYTQKES